MKGITTAVLSPIIFWWNWISCEDAIKL